MQEVRRPAEGRLRHLPVLQEPVLRRAPADGRALQALPRAVGLGPDEVRALPGLDRRPVSLLRKRLSPQRQRVPVVQRGVRGDAAAQGRARRRDRPPAPDPAAAADHAGRRHVGPRRRVVPGLDGRRHGRERRLARAPPPALPAAVSTPSAGLRRRRQRVRAARLRSQRLRLRRLGRLVRRGRRGRRHRRHGSARLRLVGRGLGRRLLQLVVGRLRRRELVRLTRAPAVAVAPAPASAARMPSSAARTMSR